ncbi:MAG: hypothetical protein R3B65_01500 [Candidatus Paceibacterota bacterium]
MIFSNLFRKELVFSSFVLLITFNSSANSPGFIVCTKIDSFLGFPALGYAGLTPKLAAKRLLGKIN